MNLARLLLLVIYIPVSFVIGLLLGWLVHDITGLWDHYILAFTVPLFGILGVWFIAPYEKFVAICCMYCIGLFLAYSFAFPSYYPESHALAYEPTYKPFIICVIWGFVLVSVIYTYERAAKNS